MSTVHTIGHSDLPIDEFVGLLDWAHVTRLIDVRSAPGSRHAPQYNHEALAATLAESKIDYSWIRKLGGHRPRQHGVDPALSAGWTNASFANYAAYLHTQDFADGLAELEGHLAGGQTVAFMCAEAVPWRCHRSILSDVLTARGHEVLHLMKPGDCIRHRLGAWGAKPEVPMVIYPGHPALPLAD